MNLRENFTNPNKIFVRLILITLIIHVPSYLLYALARSVGALPSQTEWESMSLRAPGPWLDAPQGFVLTLAFLAMLALPFITLLVSVTMSVEMKHQVLLIFIKGTALALLQVALGYIFLSSIFWVID